MTSLKNIKTLVRNFPLYWLLCLACFLFLESCKTSESQGHIPKAVNGVLDLRDYDFSERGNLKLDGKWEFYWQQLLKPIDFDRSANFGIPDYFEVPNIWNGYFHKGTKLPSDGYATFRLRILTNSKSGLFGIKVKDMSTAFSLWVNEILLISNGKVAKDRATSQPQYLPQIAFFNLDSSETIITLQISNFDHRKGGFRKPIYFGAADDIRSFREKRLTFEIFLFGTLYVISIYHFGIFLMRRKDKTALLFSFVSFLLGTRVLLTGERVLIFLFPDINWEFILKIEYLTVYISTAVFYLFLANLYQEFSEALKKLAIFSGSVFSLITLLTPVKVFSFAIGYFQIIIVLYCFYIFFTLVRVLINKREGIIWVFLGVGVLALSTVHDILLENDLFENVALAPFGFFVFIFLQSFMLTLRLAKSFSNIEKIYEELAETNRSKDKLLTALSKSEKKYRDLVEKIDEVFFTTDLKGKITYISPSVEKIIGVGPENVINNNLVGYLHVEDVAEVQQRFKRALKGEEQQAKCRVLTDIDTNRWVHYNVRPITENQVIVGLQGLVTDVTESKKAQELMIQSEKMMSVGGLAAGMAHELNNPLGAILQATQLIKRRLIPDQKRNFKKIEKYRLDSDQLQAYLTEQKVLYYLDGIQDSGKRAASVITNMLQFSRKNESQMKSVDLVKLVETTIELASNSYDLERKIDFKRINIIKQFEAGSHKVFCVETQIEQVILNLLINAAQALFSKALSEKPVIIIKISSDENFSKIEIGDNGPGMDEKTCKRVFEPFFTTKTVGKGTGLGLSVSYMIIANNHSGTFQVESEPNKGTNFIIRLPVNQKLSAAKSQFTN